MTMYRESVHFQVDINGCHQWIRTTTRDGYGHSSLGGRHVYAHRVIWEEAHGPLAEGMTVDHLCFNPGCINLDHLRELDFLANSRLQRSALKTHCKHGHEFTPENTYRRPSDGRRACKTCKVRISRAWRARRAAA